MWQAADSSTEDGEGAQNEDINHNAPTNNRTSSLRSGRVLLTTSMLHQPEDYIMSNDRTK
jgi:hypothetical protein